MKLIVLNLPRDLGEEDLTELFEDFGQIKACNLVLDAETGNSKGFGFVEMAEQNEALAAIKGLHGRKISKNKIRVKPADPHADLR